MSLMLMDNPLFISDSEFYVLAIVILFSIQKVVFFFNECIYHFSGKWYNMMLTITTQRKR